MTTNADPASNAKATDAPGGRRRVVYVLFVALAGSACTVTSAPQGGDEQADGRARPFLSRVESGSCVPPRASHPARGEVVVGEAALADVSSRGRGPSDHTPDMELCPLGASDSDEDGLCDETEERLGTDPELNDTDGDSLLDFDELFGMTLRDAVGTEGSTVLLDLPAYGADPRRRDLFVEVDYYPENVPSVAALQRVVDAFAEAPLDNPDGSTGIALHVLLDDQIASHDADPHLGNPEATLSSDPLPLDIWFEFARIKLKYADRARHAAFHYSLWANRLRGGSDSGISFQIVDHDFIVTFGGEPASELQQAGTFMHELGHNLGLMHGGARDDNHQPNYLSVMNYIYQFEGLRRDGQDVLDYSRHTVAALDETAIDERLAMAPGVGTRECDLARYGVRLCLPKFGACRFELIALGNASENLDLNYDLAINDSAYPLDLNLDDEIDLIPSSQNDWLVLDYTGNGLIGVPDSWERSAHSGAAEIEAEIEAEIAPCPGPLEDE